jgi:hypothetical protein
MVCFSPKHGVLLENKLTISTKTLRFVVEFKKLQLDFSFLFLLKKWDVSNSPIFFFCTYCSPYLFFVLLFNYSLFLYIALRKDKLIYEKLLHKLFLLY